MIDHTSRRLDGLASRVRSMAKSIAEFDGPIPNPEFTRRTGLLATLAAVGVTLAGCIGKWETTDEFDYGGNQIVEYRMGHGRSRKYEEWQDGQLIAEYEGQRTANMLGVKLHRYTLNIPDDHSLEITWNKHIPGLIVSVNGINTTDYGSAIAHGDLGILPAGTPEKIFRDATSQYKEYYDHAVEREKQRKLEAIKNISPLLG